jgi:hypothetical protein
MSRDHASPVRTILQAVAALSSFAPVAALSSGALASPDALLRQAFGLGVAVALASAWSISEERWPDAEDRDLARIAHRFSPLAVGLAITVIATFNGALGWGGLKILVASGVALMPFVHVPRVRAIQTLVCGVIAVGATALDAASAWALLPFSFAVAGTSALDCDSEARLAAGLQPQPAVGVPLALSAAVTAIGALLFALAAWLLPELRPLASGAHRPRPLEVSGAHDGGVDLLTLLELAAVLLGLAALLVIYHYFAERRRKRKPAEEEDELLALGEPLAAAAPVDPDLIANELPPGPRREIVRRYLSHIERLRSRGVPRPASGTPRELARFLEKRVADRARALPRDLAETFGRARWSEREAVPEGEASRFGEKADEVEREV